MTDTSNVALATSFGDASGSPPIDESPSPERRRRNPEDWPRHLRRREASAYLREVHGLQVAPSTLAKAACLGGGPIFESFGRFPYYRPEMLDTYAESRLSGPRRSTSDSGGDGRIDAATDHQPALAGSRKSPAGTGPDGRSSRRQRISESAGGREHPIAS
jgi:hypothetical protein